MTAFYKTLVRPAPIKNYPLAQPMFSYGAIAGIFCAIATQDLLAGCMTFTLFVLIGQSWRADMLPVLPFVLSYQWLAISFGYFFLIIYGRYPGYDENGFIQDAVIFSLLALAGILIGMRLGQVIFRKYLDTSLKANEANYDINKLFILTVVFFIFNYIYDVVPTSYWFGAAQILSNLLDLRFLPFFALLVVVFSRRRGYNYAVLATGFVMLPEFLTGFSGFKEILLIFMVALAMQWKPWLKSPEQARYNVTLFVSGLTIFLLLFWAGLVWTGGLKEAWRDLIWHSVVDTTPLERLALFIDLAINTANTVDVERTIEVLASRFSSGVLYFSYVIERIPDTIPFENGTLFAMALENATTPRILFPDKINLGGDSWIVRKFAGLYVAGEESKTSVGLGYPGEFYIDFGVVGVALLSTFFGLFASACMAAFAHTVRNRELFFALVAILLTKTMMSIDGSFIKLFAGMLQQTVIGVAVLYFMRPILMSMLTRQSSAPADSPIGTNDAPTH